MAGSPDLYKIREVKRITLIGIFCNLALSAVKFVVGILGSSQAVIADAVHSVSDLATDFAVIFGVKYWSAPPDEEHPYGHLRIEAMVTTVIGLALAGVAASLAFKALSNLRESHVRPSSVIALIGPFISIMVKEWLYRRTVQVGERVKSSAVVANAWHHRSDALSSLPALIAVSISLIRPDWAFVDHIGAIIISLFILKISWDVIHPSLSELTDRGASSMEQDAIRRHAMNVEGVRDVHKIRTRRLGSNLHVDLHILVDPDMSVRQGHEISMQVKRTLVESQLNILDVIVHLEPLE
ncbi:cation transporter [candidate division KSB1 bacterium RBG_16_48_16]|nr:MAG: cation transporter [candidate division KSB1 bacterium RBG_16_48_16]